MAEIGNINNIAQFGIMRDRANALGPTYAPTNASISAAALAAKYTAADNAQTDFIARLVAAKGPINDRQVIFLPTEKLVTRTLNYYRSTGATPQAIADAKSLADRFRGHGIKSPTLPDGTTDPDHVSNSHQGYIQRTETFATLIALYQTDPLYAPAGPSFSDITIAALTTILTAMKASNDAVSLALAPFNLARIARDKELYAPTTGLYDLQNLVKLYAKAAFGATSQQAKQFTTLRFTKPRHL